MRVAYPLIKPYQKQYLDVDNRHRLYIEESGNPDGLPVLFVHGGPGSGAASSDRCFFDPEKYRIILFDQRGSGKSTPHASLENNTTAHLLADMEKIRSTLEIEQWMLFGGSWGSTLSLLYAQAHPARVLALILRGIFLCRQSDLDWFYKAGANRVFPDYWRDFIDPIPAAERGDLIAAYYTRLTGNNELVRMAAAKQWASWEARCATLNPSSQVLSRFINPHTALSLASIESHYFMNNAFIEEGQILRDVDKLSGVPGLIVHGRYDMICPIDQAYELHRNWPGSRLEVVRDAGHSSSDPGIVDALVKATDDLAREFFDAS